MLSYFARANLRSQWILLNGRKRGRPARLNFANGTRHKDEIKFHALFDALDEGFCVVQVLFDRDDAPYDFRFLQINHSFEAQTGIKNAVGRTMLEIAPAHETSWFEIYGLVALTGQPRRFEKKADAFRRWYDVYAFRVGKPLKREVGILFKDITQRKQDEEALKSQAELLELAHDAIIVRGVKDEVLFWNGGAIETYGWTREEALGRIAHELLRTRFPKPLNDFFTELAGTGRWEGELGQIRKDGKKIVVASRWAAQRDAAGRLRGFLEINRDITARKEAEKALGEASMRKDEFLATLAHELRNPLSSISNATRVLKAGSTASASLIDILNRQTNHLVRLVDDLVEASRISRGKIQVCKEAVDLIAILIDAVETCRTILEKKGHSVTIRVPDAPVMVFGDAVRLTQITTNLIVNAAKYTPQNGNIEMKTACEGEEAVLRVCDNGVGIAAEMLPLVFDLFTQIKTTDRPGDGLGIGLSLVRKLVELHGGRIEAHSAGIGRGSEFIVRLPLMQGPLPPTAIETVPKSEMPRGAKSLRALVVDDDPDVGKSFGLMLESLGLEVRVARDGLAGIASIDEFKPDLIFLDLGMPGIDGFETAHRIRSRSFKRPFVLVALTGWGRPEDRQRTKKAGFDAHLTKPASTEAIQALLEQLRPTKPVK